MSAPGENHNFSWHGLVSARVTGPAWLIAPVEHEFAFHRVPELDLPDVEVTLARAGEGGHTSGFEYEWNGAHAGAHWRVLAGAMNIMPWRVRFEGDLLSRYIVSKWIVEPAVRVAAESKGFVMSHAAAITDGRQAILVAGEGGAGKTTWVLNWLGAGHPYLSDDFSLLNNDRVMPYITPLRLGLSNLILNPVLKNIAFTDRAEIFFRTAIRRALLNRAKFYFKSPIQRAVPGIAVSEPVGIAGAIYLRKGNENARKLDTEELSALMASVNRAEMHGFGGPWLPDDFWQQHQNKLAAALASQPAFSAPAQQLPRDSALHSIPGLISWLDSRI